MKIRIKHDADTGGYTVVEVDEMTPIGPEGGDALVMDKVQANAVAYLIVHELKKEKKT